MTGPSHEDERHMDVRTVGVIGSGTIGRGVAQSFAQYGFDVLLSDISQRQLDSALAEIASNLRLQSLFTGRKATGSAADVLARITASTGLNQLETADFVIENVTEDWDIKRAVYVAVDEICRPEVIFGVNTSAVPITRVGSVTSRPERVIGLHFMNPVPLIKMVEVIRGHFTSDQTLDVALGLLKEARKEGVVVADMPGFVTNRVLMLTINESAFCVQDQVATASDVDRIFKGCFGHKMGPLETADLIGLDTVLNSLTVMYDSYRDCKFRPAPLLRRLVDAGQLGRKTGAGFYNYSITSPSGTGSDS
jgi:3-hydroxybutyryl-CoA dehydrogenase